MGPLSHHSHKDPVSLCLYQPFSRPSCTNRIYFHLHYIPFLLRRDIAYQTLLLVIMRFPDLVHLHLPLAHLRIPVAIIIHMGQRLDRFFGFYWFYIVVQSHQGQKFLSARFQASQLISFPCFRFDFLSYHNISRSQDDPKSIKPLYLSTI